MTTRLPVRIAALLLLAFAGSSCESLPGEPGQNRLQDLPGWRAHPTHPGTHRVH